MPPNLPWNVEKYYCMHLVLLQLGRQIFTVALQGHKLGQTLPLPLEQILSAGLTVEHLVPQTRVELLRMSLCKSSKDQSGPITSYTS